VRSRGRSHPAITPSGITLGGITLGGITLGGITLGGVGWGQDRVLADREGLVAPMGRLQWIETRASSRADRLQESETEREGTAEREDDV